MSTKKTEYQQLMEAINSQGEKLNLRFDALEERFDSFEEEMSFTKDNVLRLGGQGHTFGRAISSLQAWRSKMEKRINKLESK